jgi:hypothetical protein
MSVLEVFCLRWLSLFLFVSPLFTEFALNSATIACAVLAVCVKIRVRMP